MTYTKESLIEQNQSYNHEHRVSDSDVEMANIYVTGINKSRSRLGKPVCGDILMVDGKRAHIESVEDGQVYICENAYTPFITCRFIDSRATIATSTSGGPWKNIPIEKVKATKEKKLKTFCFFGHVGMTGNGAIDIDAEVNVFTL